MRSSSCSARASSNTSIRSCVVTALTAISTIAASVIAAPNVSTRALLLLTMEVTMIPAMPTTNTAAQPRVIHRFAIVTFCRTLTPARTTRVRLLTPARTTRVRVLSGRGACT